MSRETVLITGASTGIGFELAKLFAADGSHVVMVARNRGRLEKAAEELKQLSAADVTFFDVDLSKPGSPASLFERLLSANLSIDVLVNNAGFGLLGDFVALPLEEQMEMVELNVTTLTWLARQLVPGMVERGRGGVLNVASTAAYQPGPGMAVYYATKAYVQSLSEALAYELKETGVVVTSLAPGPVQTEFGARSGMESKEFFQRSALTPERVAREGYRAFRAGHRTVTPGIMNRVGIAAASFAPRSMGLSLVNRMQRSS